MILIKTLMPGYNEREIRRYEMCEYTRLLDGLFLFSIRGGSLDGEYHHCQYPRRTIGHSHLPEKGVVNGDTFYIRHCVLNFGTNSLAFDFALSEDKHDHFPDWDPQKIKDSLSILMVSVLRMHSDRTADFKCSLRYQLQSINDLGVILQFCGWQKTERPALVGTHRINSRRKLYRAEFYMDSTFHISKPIIQHIEI